MGKKLTEEHRSKIQKSIILYKGTHKQKTRDTDIERIMEATLRREGISYEKQVPLCDIAVVDFYIPEFRIAIFCDGEYWHNTPKAKKKDPIQNSVLSLAGISVYRFWGKEIKKSPLECLQKIKFSKTDERLAI